MYKMMIILVRKHELWVHHAGACIQTDQLRKIEHTFIDKAFEARKR